MNNPMILEACYKQYMKNISKWLPDGIIEVNLELLHHLNLLHFHSKKAQDSALTRYFHVIEADEKLTLANEDFVVWIVPNKIDSVPVTYTLIALNKNDQLQLELAFMTRGIYNNSHLVLSVLEKYLQEIQVTEELINKFRDN